MKCGNVVMKNWNIADWYEEWEDWYKDLEDCRFV